ncbi:MAG: NAD-dependent epimerase/dehydratase family protein [Anaerolineae bacterium]|nr:NAD-dependent epimerase/dehydratase family protein [Phycisphaerae bacterium]
MQDLSGKTFFITGASGYVGRHLVPTLLAANAAVRCLSRTVRTRSQPLERCEAVLGDLDSAETYRANLRGCDGIIHCAKSDHPDERTRARHDLEATQELLRESIGAGVRRFVQLSSISVYIVPPDGTIDETSPRSQSTNPYVRSKIAIEQLVSDSAAKIETVVLQPANVYGHAGGWWSGALLEMMKRGDILLVNGGNGMANMVHVDDVVRAILLAVAASNVCGECILITDGQPVSWRVYFDRLQTLAGRAANVRVSVAEAKRISRELNDRSLIARVTRWSKRKLFGRPILFPLADESIDKFASKAVFRIDKARSVLNYQPSIDLDSGMATVGRTG